MKLSDLNIRRARPAEEIYKMFDGGGLYPLVEPGGGKHWRYKCRFNGREKLMAFGKYPDVPLQEARRRHQKAQGQLAQNIDPPVAKGAMLIGGRWKTTATRRYSSSSCRSFVADMEKLLRFVVAVGPGRSGCRWRCMEHLQARKSSRWRTATAMPLGYWRTNGLRCLQHSMTSATA